jgi:hypothetical protein
MVDGFHVHPTDLGLKLVETWRAQAEEGFLLTDPAKEEIPTRQAYDEASGVSYRFRWMPHREIRGNVRELERRGILNPDRDVTKLFGDPRDPYDRHCFLCKDNVVECHPKERIIPMTLAGSEYYAGANFAWIEPDHFTIMAAEHTDQHYSRHVLEAMVDLHVRTAGRFRVLFNGPGAGATIPWHLHLQITTEPMPIEQLHPNCEEHYPTAICRYHLAEDGLVRAHRAAKQWLSGDEQYHSLNILIASPGGDPQIFVFPRDRRHATAEGKGLVGGFEVSGDFVLSAPHERGTFENASVAVAKEILGQVCPPDWGTTAAA